MKKILGSILLVMAIVFSTKNREPVLLKERRKELYKYIWGICKNKKCYLYQINGIEDHIHILVDIASTISISEFVRDLKTNTTRWLKENQIFPDYKGWQGEYAAFTASYEQRDVVIQYIKNQETHHKHESFVEEMMRFYDKVGIQYEKKYL